MTGTTMSTETYVGHGRKLRVSICICTKNRVQLLKRAIDSVVSCCEHEALEAELVVIDGASTDGTRSLLESYGNRIAYWISEPDSCVAEAVNKALAVARGDAVLLMGDDDELLAGQLGVLLQIFAEHQEYAVVAGHNQVWFEELDGSKVTCYQEKFSGNVGWQDFVKYGRPKFLVPEVCLFRRSVLEKFGGFDASLKWFGFLDLFYRMLAAGHLFFVVPITILNTYQTPFSDTRSNLGNNAKFSREYRRVIRKHVGVYWGLWHYFGGKLNPINVAYVLLVRLASLTGIHPRRIRDRFVRRMKTSMGFVRKEETL
jgi:glycosyltransferase